MIELPGHFSILGHSVLVCTMANLAIVANLVIAGSVARGAASAFASLRDFMRFQA